MPDVNVSQNSWGFEETLEERRSFLDRLRRRKEPRRLTSEEMGGPPPAPLIAGKFAGPDLSLRAYLGADRFIMPGHDPGAVEQWRDEQRGEQRPFPGVTERPSQGSR
jgi:hypothetical protein